MYLRTTRGGGRRTYLTCRSNSIIYIVFVFEERTGKEVLFQIFLTRPIPIITLPNNVFRWKVMSLLKLVFMTLYPRAHAGWYQLFLEIISIFLKHLIQSKLPSDDLIIWVRMLRDFGLESQIGMTPWLWER